MSELAIGVVLAVLVFLGLGSQHGPTFQSLPRSVVLFGDSLAVGLRPPMARLAAASSTPFHADVRGGTNAGQWLGMHWAENLLRKHRPTLALISLGTNDNYIPGRGEVFAERARALTELCTRYGARAVWLVPPVMPRGSPATLAGIVSTGALRIDAPAGLPRAGDRIHSTPAGYEQWARAAWAGLP